MNNRENNKEFQDIIKEIIENETVQEMKKYPQHCDTNCFDHCYNVAYCCYKVTKKFHLDYRSATRAAMLHDLFLYNWREKSDRKGLHAFTHGKLACEIASGLFELNNKEKDMIKKHMWPLTPIPPKSIEGFILTIVDKYCTIKETSKYVYRKI